MARPRGPPAAGHRAAASCSTRTARTTAARSRLNDGDLLLLYTDGLAEARNGDQLFGEERIANSLRRDPGVAAGVLCKNLLEAARDFASEPIERRRGHPGHPPHLTWPSDDDATGDRPSSPHSPEELARLTERALAGNLARGATSSRPRTSCSCATGWRCCSTTDSFVEDGLLANTRPPTCPADGVVTGVGRIDGRPVCVMANDPTVKAGSWGARTVEKIVRLTEHALRHELPVFWLVDSAGARITDQVQLFPGRRGAGRIFYNQVRLSGGCPRSAACSGPRPPAAPTSRASATWCSWSRATPRCTWVRPAWPRW